MVGFQNFVEDKTGLEEGNCLTLLLLLGLIDCVGF